MNEKKTFRRQATLQVFGFQKISNPLFFVMSFTIMEYVIEEAVHFERTKYLREQYSSVIKRERSQ